jgi:outer membrane protein assembly factor BamB
MRQRWFHAMPIFSLLFIFILSSCSDNAAGPNDAGSKTATSKTVLMQTNTSLSVLSTTGGSPRWSLSQSGGSSTSIVISANHIYSSSSGSNIVAIDSANGKQIWSAPIASHTSDLQASSTLVYALSDDLLSAFDATSGALKWHMDKIGLDFLDSNGGGNFILSGNTIYTLVSGKVSALNATTGSQLWQFTPSALDTEKVAPTVKTLALSPDGKTLLIKYYLGSSLAHALYAVHTDSHQEAWHLDPTDTEDHTTYHDMSLDWFSVTSDNHVFLYASFSGPGQHLTFEHPQEFRYLALSDGSMVWSLPLPSKSNFSHEGNGGTMVVGDGTFYSIGGPSGGDISTTTLSNHQQAWNIPGSGSYESLYLQNDVLLAWSDADSKVLTAFSTRDGKQLWQQTQSIHQIAIAGQSVFVEQREYITRDGVVNVLDLHNGQKQWSMPIKGGSSIINTILL